jgi:hypothetical protein
MGRLWWILGIKIFKEAVSGKRLVAPPRGFPVWSWGAFEDRRSSVREFEIVMKEQMEVFNPPSLLHDEPAKARD